MDFKIRGSGDQSGGRLLREREIYLPLTQQGHSNRETRVDGQGGDGVATAEILLALADDLGARLRATDQIATGVTCPIRYADLSATRRSRTLPEATHHTVLLARAAYAVYDSLGLQHARVRSIALRADALRPADRATRQLTLDQGDDKPLAIDAVADRTRTRYRHQALYPAALAVTQGRPPHDRDCNAAWATEVGRSPKHRS